MKVYVLEIRWGYADTEVLGVYDSFEKAKAAIKYKDHDHHIYSKTINQPAADDSCILIDGVIE